MNLDFCFLSKYFLWNYFFILSLIFEQDFIIIIHFNYYFNYCYYYYFMIFECFYELNLRIWNLNVLKVFKWKFFYQLLILGLNFLLSCNFLDLKYFRENEDFVWRNLRNLKGPLRYYHKFFGFVLVFRRNFLSNQKFLVDFLVQCLFRDILNFVIVKIHLLVNFGLRVFLFL